MTLLGVIGPGELLILLFAAVFVFMLPIIALVDIVRNKFEGNMQLIWVLIVLFLNILGAILYFVIGRRQKIRSQKIV